jgi:hypothetical protein
VGKPCKLWIVTMLEIPLGHVDGALIVRDHHHDESGSRGSDTAKQEEQMGSPQVPKTRKARQRGSSANFSIRRFPSNSCRRCRNGSRISSATAGGPAPPATPRRRQIALRRDAVRTGKGQARAEAPRRGAGQSGGTAGAAL